MSDGQSGRPRRRGAAAAGERSRSEQSGTVSDGRSGRPRRRAAAGAGERSRSERSGTVSRARRSAVLVLGATVAATALLGLTGCARQIAGNAIAAVSASVSVSDQAASSAPASSAPVRKPPPDPCQLVSKAEAEVLADRDLQAGVPSGDEKGEPTLCEYTAPPDTPGVAQVSIGVGDGALKFLQIDRDTLGHPFTQPAGIGDEAWQEDGHIFVRKGAIWVSVELVTLDADPTIPDRLQDLARTIASRLG